MIGVALRGGTLGEIKDFGRHWVPQSQARVAVTHSARVALAVYRDDRPRGVFSGALDPSALFGRPLAR